MRIYIEEINRRGRFDARLDDPDGHIIVVSSRQPLLDAARILQREGKTGTLEMWGGNPPILRMSGKIEAMADLAVEEDGMAGPRFKALRRVGASPAAGKMPPDGLGA